MKENNRKSIASIKKLPQFTTMNVIDGQAGLVNYSSLIFYSLTIDNILNIIILLILAGITIGLITGDNGILTQVTRAKEETENAQKEEEKVLTSYEDYINNTTLDTAVVGKIVTGDNKQYSNNGTAIIPEGFMIVPGCDDVSQGLVISDNKADQEIEGKEKISDGNQFVWVPVPKFSDFKRYHFYENTEVSDNFTENSGDGIKHGTEAEAMYKSVNENGGFYIGRYEAGKEAENAVSKKGINVYNNIIWGNSITDETGGAVEKARNFDTQSGHSNVTSTLVYGVQWDAIMRWLSNGTEEEKRWVTNSVDKGNYLDENPNNNPAKTGAVEEYQMKHIYDLAGNVSEWTMEGYSTNQKVFRGGNYTNDNVGKGQPCSHRGIGPMTNNVSQLGFRIAMYL